ncbi:nucleoside phosphorylase domain-containing protein [Aspergillus undulatus]|uniref:nucleoside phosphorylase domain-containing protein n=1 Tax=Aspergillus undulatus TaxID=1810928 RepID=UPI003CCCC4A6
MTEPREPTVYDYTVGIICALDKELLAVRYVLDSTHPEVAVLPRDTNTYTFGTLSKHGVVATCLPAAEYGTNAAASVASQMYMSFPDMQFCLLVGIAGGVPGGKEDVRLGDVVIGVPTGIRPGVIQYDMGKATPDDSFLETGSLQRPPRVLLSAINGLRSNPQIAINPLMASLEIIARQNPKYASVEREHDILFPLDCVHGLHEANCEGHLDLQVQRPARSLQYPCIHYGLIASGNSVMRDAALRDRLAHRYGFLCFEMEAAGILNILPSLVIRGICDYSDSHKSKVWQEYAAAAAAAYAKLLLTQVRVYNARSTGGTHLREMHSPPSAIGHIGVDTSLGYGIYDACKTTRNPSPSPLTDQTAPCRSPEDIWSKAQSFAERHRLWSSIPTEAVPLMAALNEWSQTKFSATLIIEPQSSRAAQRAETFAFEVAAFLKRRGQSIIWAFTPEYDEPLTTGDIMHCLAQQAQRTLPAKLTVTQCSDMGSPASLTSIFDVLGNSFLVVQVQDRALGHALLEALKSAFHQPGRVLKLLLVSYHPDMTSRALGFPQATVQALSPPIPKARRRDARVSWWECINPTL